MDETTSYCEVHESSHSKVFFVDSSKYQSILNHDSRNLVAMKILKNQFPKPDEIERFYKEYEMLRGISHPGIRRVLAKTKLRNKHTVFLEWVDGVTISEYGRRDLEEFLSLSRQIVEALAELHAHRIVHNNISSNDIMVNCTTRQIKIIGMGHCSTIEEKMNNVNDDALLENDLHFLSPDKVLDYRSDLYSLGCVFYYMLSGKLPFESYDQSQLQKSHLNCRPLSLREIHQTVPAPLSDLVVKLMEKNPNDRYQSAKGLLYDLNMMNMQLQSDAEIASDFILAQRDCSNMFQVIQQLYGRTDQVTTLLSAFDRVCEGCLEIVLVNGCSGTGKSSLVNELHMPVIKKGGFFINGKYDPLQLFEPCSGVLQAFSNFCDEVLEKSCEIVDRFRIHIKEAVGAEGKILTDVIPKLHFIIGDQPDVPEVSGMTTKNRFNNVFCKFVKAISTADHPVLLFIDDLQWADSASLDLLSVLMMDKDIKYLLFVSACRDEECESHPLADTLDKIKNDVIIQKIQIGNLSKDNINEFISDALTTAREETYPLADLVHGKTHGNAFFVNFFMKTLLNENLLHFCYNEFKWKWDSNKITAKHITENVAELMSKKILKLSKKTQNILKIASCLGNNTDLFLLELIVGEDLQFLDEAIFEGVILLSTTENKKLLFSHDQIYEVVYSLIPRSDRDTLHLRIGRILQRKLFHLMKLDEYLFVVTNKLNTDLDMVTDENERAEIARLNLRAGKKARSSSAFELAAKFLSVGIKLLGPNRWKDYELSLKLYSAAAEMDYCNGDYDHMDKMLEEVFENASSILDKVESFVILIKAFRARNKFHDAMDTGMHALKLLGETFPENANDLLFEVWLYRTEFSVWNRNNGDIASLPIMEDKKIAAAMWIMAHNLGSARFARKDVLPFLVFRMVQLTMRYGVTKRSIFGFAWFGIVYCTLGNYEKGYRIGKLVPKLLERFNEKKCQCWTYFILNCGINHWKEKNHLSLEPLQQAIKIGYESGEIEMSCYAAWRYCCHSFLGGNPLARIEEEMKLYCEQIATHKQQHILMMLLPFRQAVLNFMGCGSENPINLTVEETCDKNMFAGGAIKFNCMILAYFFHEYEIAAMRAEESKKILQGSPSIYENSNHVFYHGLISLALARETENNEKWINIANESIAYMKKLAEINPANFLHKSHLLEAEMAIINGCQVEAMDHFNKAIDLAEAQKFMHEEALACERAGIHYIKTDRKLSGSKLLSRAYQIYREWGAEAKTHQLELLYGSQITDVVQN